MIEKRTRKKRHKGIAAIAAAALLATTLLVQPVCASDADETGLDIQRPCRITVKDPEKKLSENVVYDVYQIAKATSIPGADAYEFDFTVPEAEAYYNENIRDNETIDAQTLNTFAQIPAAQVKEAQEKKETPSNKYKENLPVGNTAEVEAGMYLVILHDNTGSAYWAEDASAVISTAKVGEETYSFAPILVSVPTRDNPADEKGSTTFVSGLTVFNGTVSYANTADSGGWVYDLTVDPKMGIEEEGIPIEITKTIDTYDASAGDVTVVFEVKAVKKLNVDGEIIEKTVYDNDHVVTFSFNSPLRLTQTRRITDEATGKEIRVPIDAEVTVTEVHEGASYITEDSKVKNAVRDDGRNVFEVSYTNTYQETKKSGGAAVNNVHVEPDPDDPSGYKWVIERIPTETVE